MDKIHRISLPVSVVALLLIILGGTPLSAQIAPSPNVTGLVQRSNDDGTTSPIAGVNVRWLGTAVGTVSKQDGRFSLPRSDSSDTLQFTYAGFEGRVHVTPEMNEVNVALDFVVPMGEVAVEEDRSGIGIDAADIRTTEIISKDEMLRAACCNLSEAFETNVSVDVAPVDAVTGAQQIQLLGLKGVYTQMIIENYPGARGLAVPYALEYIPGPWMQSIHISKGSASVLNGYESITGLINVELIKPWSSEPVLFNAFANHFGRAEANVNAGTDLSDEWSTMLLAHGNYYDTEYDGNGDDFLDIPRKSQVNAFNRWSYIDPEKDVHFGANVIWDRHRGGQDGYTFSAAGSGLYGFEAETRRYVVFGKSGFVLDTENNASMALLLNATHHEQDAFFGVRDYSGQQQSLYARFLYQSDFFAPEHSVTAGASLQLDDYDEKLDLMSLKRFESVPGIFGEYTYKGIDQLTAVFGLRADAHNIFGTFVTPRMHLRYRADDLVTLRMSAGRGTRVANVLAENFQVLSSSREVVIEEDLRPERAWNYGISGTAYFDFLGTTFALDAEFFRTDFDNQIIVDRDRDSRHVYFYNLDGRSFSNSLQTQLSFTILEDIDLRVAYRWYDVQSTFDGTLRRRPLQSPHKTMLSAGWTPEESEWQIDGTIMYHSGGRVPATNANPVQYRVPANFDGYFHALAQVTRRFDYFELYLGSENLTGFRQDRPIIAADTPYGPYFDASLVWGPIHGRTLYLGARMTLESVASAK